MIPRHLPHVLSNVKDPTPVRFLMGPRSCGKTTLLGSMKIPTAKIFDEIQTRSRWSQEMRGVVDSKKNQGPLWVAGSARLDLLPFVRKNLGGVYQKFHLFPLSLREIVGLPPLWLSVNLSFSSTLIDNRLKTQSADQSLVERLLAVSGFPVSFENNHKPVGIPEFQVLDSKRKGMNIPELLNCVAQQVGRGVSVHALQEIMQEGYHPVLNGLELLDVGFVTFDVRPYAKKLPKSLAKEKKIYLFNWTIISDESRRFENYVAHELYSWVHAWSEAGLAHFELRTFPQASREETKFLIIRERKPWLLLDASLTPGPIEEFRAQHAESLGGIPFVRVVKEPHVILADRPHQQFQISAAQFFG
ncbi:MAG: hypothetical protein KCHDKBKB_01162 [Elusimicrobia bacterium]|nr:hypothetical protein [Elusimicrobiota bacterium]